MKMYMKERRSPQKDGVLAVGLPVPVIAMVEESGYSLVYLRANKFQSLNFFLPTWCRSTVFGDMVR